MHAGVDFVAIANQKPSKKSKFEGARPGWYFGRGPQGLGYHRDKGLVVQVQLLRETVPACATTPVRIQLCEVLQPTSAIRTGLHSFGQQPCTDSRGKQQEYGLDCDRFVMLRTQFEQQMRNGELPEGKNAIDLVYVVSRNQLTN